MLELSSVQAGYGEGPVLRGLDLAVERGERVALLGANGAGKTTLVRVATGLLEPTRGTVRVGGTDPGLRRRTALRDVGVMRADEPGPPHATPLALLRWAVRHHGAAHEPEALLDRVGLSHRRHDPMSALSHGLRRRVELALALVGDPDLLILDEPTTGMDLPLKRGLWEDLRSVRDRALLVATHDPAEVLAVATRVAVLRDGRVEVHLHGDHLRDRGLRSAAASLTELMGAAGEGSSAAVRRP